jgi:hypothetical protein
MRQLFSPQIRLCIYIHKNHIFATYPTIGMGNIQFWVRRLIDKESIHDFDVEKIFKRTEIPKSSRKWSLI